MDIVAKIEEKLVKYLEQPYCRWPDFLYMSQNNIMALDKKFGGLVFQIYDVEIIETTKREWLEFGERI